MRRTLLLFALTLPAWSESALQREIRTLAAGARGTVGVACSLPGTTLDCSLHSQSPLPMQSVYKLPIAMAVLDAIEHQRFSLNQKVRFLAADSVSNGQHSPLRDAHPQGGVDVSIQELLRLAVSESDGTASDILLRTLGGPRAVDSYIRHIGISGMRIIDTEKTIGKDVQAQYRNSAQPAAMVALLRRLNDDSPLTSSHTALLLQWMTVGPTGEHRLKGLLPAGTSVAHKTGTSGQDNGITHATNDIGLITLPTGRRLAIAVFITDSPADEKAREAVIARIAYAVWVAASRLN
jgi:beta-lactamase class A